MLRRAKRLLGACWRAPRLEGELADAKKKLAHKRREVKRLKGRAERGVAPENLVWVFGSGRTGSTWLASMLGDLEGAAVLNEPYVGEVFGWAYERAPDWQRNRRVYVLSEKNRGARRAAIRALTLGLAASAFPRLAADGLLVVKEPHGTVGAPLIVDAFPESRVVVLLRDPRDVTASAMKAHTAGSWTEEVVGGPDPMTSLVGRDPDAFVRGRAAIIELDYRKALEAHEVHQGPKTVVRYEDLRLDTAPELYRVCSEIDLRPGRDGLSRIAEKHDWLNIPEEEKGEGKFRRKATPGAWREDLTEEQARIVEEVCAPVFERFYPQT